MGCSGISAGACTACSSSCSGGQYLSGCGALSPGTCSFCQSCTTGKYLSGCSGSLPGVCSTCPVGSYCPLSGLTAAIPCPAGSYCPKFGANTTTSCPVGSYCPVSNLTSPVVCPMSLYCPATGASNATSCPPGSYCPTTALTAPWACPTGSYCPISNLTSPVVCPAGLYCPGTGLITPTPCPAGSYCPRTNLTAPVPCPAGTYSSSTSTTVCTSCAAGTSYADVAGYSACISCSALVQQNCANDQIFQACTTMSDAKCVPCTNKIANANPTPVCIWTCLLGSYFKNSSGLCQACKASLTCPTGSFTLGCDTVTDESCSPCTNLPASNAYYTTNGGLGTLQSPGPCNWACNAGYFQATSQDTGCTTCPAGSISAAGSTACTPCPAGTYAATASLCLSCPGGMYASTAGSTACLSCTWCTAQGMYKQCGGSSAGTCSTCSN